MTAINEEIIYIWNGYMYLYNTMISSQVLYNVATETYSH